jgi:hypothetical protein
MSGHIFVSYATKDGSAFAERIYNDLRDEGHTVWLDQYNISPGTQWDREIDKGLDAAEVVLVVLTPHAVASRQVSSEWNRAADRNIPLVPLLAIDCEVPRLLATFQYINFEKDYASGLVRLRDALKTIQNSPRMNSMNASSLDETQPVISPTVKRVRTVGQRPYEEVEHFRDRTKEREEIRRLFSQPKSRIISVVGRGGMGKTALASRVLADLERHWELVENGSVVLDGIVYMSTRTDGITLEKIFLECTKLLDSESGKQLFRTWLSVLPLRDKIQMLLDKLNVGIYIILLDNMEDLIDEDDRLTDEELKFFLEMIATHSSNVRVLVTTRIALPLIEKTTQFTRKIHLDVGLPPDDAIEMLRDFDPDDECGLRSAPSELLARAVEIVHGNPRALELIPSILASEPLMRLEDLLHNMKFFKQERVYLELFRDNYERLSEDEQRVMQVMAVFGKPVTPQAITETLQTLPEQKVTEIVRRLVRHHMMSTDRNAGTVTLHPLDRDYIYSLLAETAR